MGWDKTIPTSGTKVYDLGSVFADNYSAIDNILTREHYPLTSTTSAGDHKIGLVSAVYEGTTAEINALSSPENGALALDKTLGTMKYRDTTWKQFNSNLISGISVRPGLNTTYYKNYGGYLSDGVYISVPFSGNRVLIDKDKRLTGEWADDPELPTFTPVQYLVQTDTYLMNLSLTFTCSGNGTGTGINYCHVYLRDQSSGSFVSWYMGDFAFYDYPISESMTKRYTKLFTSSLNYPWGYSVQLQFYWSASVTSQITLSAVSSYLNIYKIGGVGT